MFSEEVLKKVEAPSTGALPLALSSEDSMFSVMRDINFRAVGNFLSSKAKDISALFAVSVLPVYCEYTASVLYTEPGYVYIELTECCM